MRSYLVELYQPAASSDGRASVERARAAAAELTSEGTAVRYLRSIFIPEDETCLHLFEGASVEAIRELSRRAAIDYDRIVEIVDDGRSASM
jgi:hypothetical protein